MDAIDAIANYKQCNWCHHCDAPKRSRDERSSKSTKKAVAISLRATRQPWGRALWECHEYHNNTNPATTIIITDATIAATKARQTQPWTRRSSKQKPQADLANSCLRSPATRTLRSTTKHTIKNSQKSMKKHSHCNTCAMCHVHNTCWMSNADKLTDISPLHFDKTLKASCCGVPCKSDIDSQVKSKWWKERDVFFILGWRSRLYRHHLDGTWLHWCRPQKVWWCHKSVWFWWLTVHHY